jgi:hypothetical protein
MATGNRTLKLSILADVDELKKSLKTGETEVKGFSDKVGDFGKKAAAAFAIAAAAAAAYATKLAVDGVKAAIEDEQAQLRLASALRSATGATDAQIQATEDYISQTALAVGIADDALRPAFQRLSVATGDVTKSQQLLNLAIDISKGTGKDLGAVTEALSKAYGGQDTQLARLGIGITSAQAKQLSFREETEILSNLYGGAASRNAETFQGRIDRLKVGFEEAKETIGFALLPVIERLIEFIFVYGTPIVDKFRDAFNIIKDALDRNRESFNEFWLLLKDKVFPILQTVFGFLLDVGARAAAAIIDAFGKIAGAITPVLNFIIDAINLVIRGLNAVRGGSDIQQIGKIGAASSAGGTTGGFSGIPSGGGTGITGGGGGGGGFTGLGGTGITGGGGGGGVGVSGAAGATSLKDLTDKLLRVQDQFADLTFQVATGGISKSAAQKQFDSLQAQFRVLEKQGNTLAANPNIIVNISGSLDPEGTARAVARAVNESAARSTGAIDYAAVRAKAG